MSMTPITRTRYFSTRSLLCDSGADVNAQDRNGYTPLIVALGRGNAAVVSFLIEKVRLFFAVAVFLTPRVYRAPM